MKLLLDTHAALWWWMDSPNLGTAAKQALSNLDNEVHFSAVSAFEMGTQARVGKLSPPAALLSEALIKSVLNEDWKLLPLSVREACIAASMDHEHRDPFDRMLAAQSQVSDMMLVSRDPFFHTIGIDILW